MTDPKTEASNPLKEAPLLDDIRLLGQILGDTIREQEGIEVYDRIESIRRLSVAPSETRTRKQSTSSTFCCAA